MSAVGGLHNNTRRNLLEHGHRSEFCLLAKKPRHGDSAQSTGAVPIFGPWRSRLTLFAGIALTGLVTFLL